MNKNKTPLRVTTLTVMAGLATVGPAISGRAMAQT